MHPRVLAPRLLLLLAYRPRFFYGWWVVVGAALSGLLSGAFFYVGYSAFAAVLSLEFGWSKGALGGVYSLARLWQSGVDVVSGYLADRTGPRWPMVAGTVLAAAGFFLFSRVNSLAALYLVLVAVVATGLSIGHSVVPYTAVANWFVRRRGLALGIAFSGMGMSGVLIPLIGWAMETYGWRLTALAAAGAFLALGLPAAGLMRGRPEGHGLSPDGSVSPAPTLSPIRPLAEASHSLREVLRMSSFWFMAFAFTLRQMVTSGLTMHLMLVATDLRIALVTAAGFQALMGLASLPGRLGFGWLADRFDKRLVTALCMGLMAGGLWMLGSARGPWPIVLGLTIYAPAFGGSSTLPFALRGEYYGRKAFGTITGAMGVVITLGAGVGPVLAGYLRDLTGSYQLPLQILAGACLLSAALVMAIRRPRA
ncbi:MAG: MFS transporter [Chloroflexi bacterium]|nr:MFS transporter [Chloroflexota bacterium]